MKPRVTLVDDNLDFLELLTEILTEGGYEVTALTGQGTPLDEIIATRPNLVILDINFPGGQEQASGWDYLRQLRSHDGFGTVPVLICTGDLMGLRARQQELGRDVHLAVISKPFDLDQIESLIADLVSGARVPAWDDEREIVLVADASAHLVDASNAALRALGVSREELRSRDVSDIVARSREWTEAEWQRYLAARLWVGDVNLRRADGTQLEATATAEIWTGGGAEWHISRLRLRTPAKPPTAR